MHVFISYSHNQQKRARDIEAALRAAGHDPFLDTKTLPPGEEYNARIRRAIDDADLFLFLATADSLRPDSWAVTELEWAHVKWPNPSGRIMPVMLERLDPTALPPWLRPITALRDDEGNLEARVVAWVDDRAESGTGVPGVRSPRESLERWARLAQPPLRRGRRVLPARALLGMVFGCFFIAFGLVGNAMIRESPFGDSAFDLLFAAVPVMVGVIVILRGIAQMVQGLMGGRAPLAAVVLDRSTSGNNLLTLELETLGRGRITVEPVGRLARRVYAGDMGWAWIRGRLLLDFTPASDRPRDG